MAQTQRRMIYSKIWSSAQFGKLSDKAKLLFIGSITLADDDGLLIGTPSYLRGQIFPFDENISVSEALQFRDEIKNNGLFIVYSIDGIDYIEHPNWSIYQKIRKDLYKKSSLPNRNETVTKLLRKRSLSKDKISKDKIGETSSPDNKKTMKTYNENNHSDSDIPNIDLDTGETIKKPSTKKYPNALKIYNLFGKYPLNWKINKTQLQSAENLFKERGSEQIIKALEFYRENKDKEFCPTINSPYDLDSKWIKLLSFKKKQ
jgi:hypothetical protein